MAPQVGDYNNNTRQPNQPMGVLIPPGVSTFRLGVFPGHYKVYLLKKICNKM